MQRAAVVAMPVVSATPITTAPVVATSVSSFIIACRPLVTASACAAGTSPDVLSPVWQEQTLDVQSSVSVDAVRSPASADRATDSLIRYDTWVGYNSTWKYFKVTLAHGLMHLYTLGTHTLARVSLCRCGWTRPASRS